VGVNVSIVTPYRNAAGFVPAFVQMLQAQSFAGWRCLLVDDGSDDDGPALAAQCTAGDGRFCLISRPGARVSSGGPAAARNTALALVDSDWVAFCDIDDLWHPHKLERQLAFQQAHDLDLVVSGFGRFDHTTQQLIAWRCPPAALSYRLLLGSNPIPMLTVLVRTDLVREGMPSCRHEDFALWLQLFHQHPSLMYGCVPEGLAFYRVHASNLTAQRWRMAGWAWQVFWWHGLRGRALALAMGRWCADQLLNLIRQRLPQAPREPLALAALLAQPPVRLRPRNS
jgi:glycosyltransferase involved in cell wall biosynthesis